MMRQVVGKNSRPGLTWIGGLVSLLVAGCCWMGGVAYAQEGMNGDSNNQVEEQPSALTEEQKHDEAYHLRAAREFKSRQYYDAAAQECELILKKNPHNLEAYDELAKILIEMKNWAFAINTLRQLHDLAPGEPKYVILLAQICEAYSMPIQEVEAQEALIKIQPQNLHAYYRLADLYEKLDLPTDMVGAYERAAQAVPTDPEVLSRLADAYGDLNRQTDEMATLERLLKLQPDNRDTMLRLGHLYQEANKTRQSFALFAKLYHAEPQNAEYRELYADGLVDLGDEYADKQQYGHAMRYYSMAIDIMHPRSKAASLFDLTTVSGEATVSQSSGTPSSVPSATPIPNPAPADDDVTRRARERMRRIEGYTHPSIFGQIQSGVDGENQLNYNDTGVRVPIAGTELAVSGIEEYREANDTILGTSASVNLQEVKVDDRVSKHWLLTAAAGSSPTTGVGELSGTLYGDTLEGKFGWRRDQNYETPLAIQTGLSYDELFAQTSWIFAPRWELDWELEHDYYSNNNDANNLEYSLAYALIRKPEKYSFSVEYIRNEFRNTFNENDLLRFGPVLLDTDFTGVVWEQSINRSLQYRIEYFKSHDNLNEVLNNYSGRVDWAVNRRLILYAEYDNGILANGVVNVNVPDVNNDTLTTVGAQVRF